MEKVAILICVVLWCVLVFGYVIFSTRSFCKKMEAIYEGDVEWWKNYSRKLIAENERLRGELYDSGESWKSDK